MWSWRDLPEAAVVVCFLLSHPQAHATHMFKRAHAVCTPRGLKPQGGAHIRKAHNPELDPGLPSLTLLQRRPRGALGCA